MGLLEVFSVLFRLIVIWIQSVIATICPPAKKSLAGQTVLITGTGHGIGKAIALEFARNVPGVRLILWDLNEDTNNATAAEVRELGVEVHSYVCDVSSSADIHTVAQKVRDDIEGDVDVLVNNAGILYGGSILDLEERHIRRTFDINTLAHFWTVREFLPAMLKKGYGHIVNISSVAARTGTAYMIDYSSSKYAVYGMTEALEEEIRRLGKPNVRTSVVCPMFVDTGLCMFPKYRFGRMLTTEEAAKVTVDGMLRNEMFIFVPHNMWLLLRIVGLLPHRMNQFMKEDVLKLGMAPQYQHVKKD